MVNLRIDPTQKSVAQLEITGITGVLFVNLVPRESIKDYTPQKIDFISEYPVIPSQPSQIKQILTGVEEVIAGLKEIDTKGISQGAKDTFQELKNFFFGGEKTKRIINELEGSSANIKKISTKINQDMAKGDFSKILGHAKGTFEGTRTLVDKAKKDLEYMMLPGNLGNPWLPVRNPMPAEKLTQTSETLNLLIERLYARPPDLLFGQPPQKRWNE